MILSTFQFNFQYLFNVHGQSLWVASPPSCNKDCFQTRSCFLRMIVENVEHPNLVCAWCLTLVSILCFNIVTADSSRENRGLESLCEVRPTCDYVRFNVTQGAGI